MDWEPSVVSGIESFSTLWAGKEVSARPLVLPDNLRPKFYLPDEIGKQRRKQKGIERDRQRMEFLCRRDSMQQCGNNQTRFAAKKILMADNNGSRFEAEIMQRLLTPYVTDEANMAKLLSRVNDVLHSREQKHPWIHKRGGESLKEERDAFDDVDLFAGEPNSPRPPMTPLQGRSGSGFHRHSAAAEKIASVLARRKAIEDAYQQEMSRRSSVLEHRMLTANSKANSIKQDHNIVGEHWAVIIMIVKSMRILKSFIHSGRLLKLQDRLTWRAAVIIQRRWRMTSRIDSMYKAADAVLKDGHEMERAKMIATIRAESCNIIFKFLTALKSGMRSAVSGYLRKVKLLQRTFRSHAKFNGGRLLMLNVLYDKCFAAIQFLVSTHILKRLSANNTSSTAIASEKWMQKNASEPHHRILRDLMSPNALLYMKQEVLDPARKDLKRSFFSSVVVVDPLCRQAAVKDLLLKCRWEEIRSAAIKKKKMLMYEHMPVVTQQDARRFIKTGADPLSQYIKSCDDALISSEFGSDETSSLVEGRKRLIKYNMFLAHISAIDMIDIIFESILNTVQQPIKIKQAERARADSRSALDGFSRRPSHDGETNLHSRRGSKSRSNVAFGTSRDMDGDNDSDTMSINSSYSTSSRQSFSSVPIPPSGRRNSNRHKHSGRRLEVVQKKKY